METLFPKSSDDQSPAPNMLSLRLGSALRRRYGRDVSEDLYPEYGNTVSGQQQIKAMLRLAQLTHNDHEALERVMRAVQTGTTPMDAAKTELGL